MRLLPLSREKGGPITAASAAVTRPEHNMPSHGFTPNLAASSDDV